MRAPERRHRIDRAPADGVAVVIGDRSDQPDVQIWQGAIAAAMIAFTQGVRARP
jgi:hypothetical protein